MLVLKLSQASFKASLQAAIRLLRRGGVIAFPTETTYGLGCDPRNKNAVRKIFLIKGRSDKKPLQLIAGSLSQVSRIADLSRAEKSLAKKHWPGPLTLLVRLKRGRKLAPHVSQLGLIGIRVSSSLFARALAKALRHPIAATSANRSGAMPAFSGRAVVHAFKAFPHQPDLVLDVGRLPRRVPSTVARVSEDGSVEILRQGATHPIGYTQLSR